MNPVMSFVSTSLRRPPSGVAGSTVKGECLVRIAGLEKTYQSKDGNQIHALQDINLEILASEFISIVGPSGCGKTTLLKILAGIVTRSAGAVGRSGGRRAGD